MSSLPALTAREVISALRRAGFEIVRQRGSHAQLQHPDGRATTVPVHTGEDIGRGLLRKILRDVELAPEEFMKLLK
ncbi:MAG: type II toxin-antitoxin system HicA family toxin [Chloroflexi bacterium]|nr:type II toxin-antitoxin system HicA family toxin [Chloroflexota bacterium]